MTFQIPEFTMQMFAGFLFSQVGQVCVGVGWSLGDIKWQIKTKNTGKDCYKVIFNNLVDWKSDWTGDRAQWLESCVDETSPVEFTLSDAQIGTSISNQFVYGGQTVGGPGCFQFARWSNWPPGLTSTAAGFDKSLLVHSFKKMFSETFHEGNHMDEFLDFTK